jgi:hypothetical protein
MRRWNCALIGAIVGITAATLAGCSFKPKSETPGSGGAGGDSTTSGSGGTRVISDGAVFRPDTAIDYIGTLDGGDPADAGPTVDANCGNQPFTVIIPPPNLLIVLDRSQSMTEDAAGVRTGPAADKKWALMTTAIKQVVMQTETTINWGLLFFGSDTACGVATTATVPPRLNNSMAIATAIDQTTPQSYTPTSKGETNAGAYLATLPDMGRKFILLATDGQPTCGPPNFNSANDVDDPGAIKAVADVAAMGIPTYVIGIATTGNATADGTLSQMAVMGGQPRAATPPYYPVSTTADLVTALNEIKSIVMGMCTYPLGMPTENADITKTTVTVDGTKSPQGDPDGWDFDPGMKSITFKGTTCANLMAGTSKDVQILFGCKVVVM